MDIFLDFVNFATNSFYPMIMRFWEVVGKIFTTSLSELMLYSPNIIVKLISFLIPESWANTPLCIIMLGYGLYFFVVYTLLSWFLNLVT